MATYTAKEVADILRRPATTIRTWADNYKDFIPQGEKRGGRRRYNDEGLDVFKKIAELHSRGIIGEDVKEQLGKDFSLQVDDEGMAGGVSENALVLRQQYQETINFFMASLKKSDEILKLQREEIALQREEITVLKDVLGYNKPKGEFHATIKKNNDKPKKVQPKKPVSKKKTVKKQVRGKGGRFKKKSWFEKLLS